MKIDIPDWGQVDVLDRRCALLECLRPGHTTHRSPGAGASGCSSWSDRELSCLTRDNCGCPARAERRPAPEAWFHEDGCLGLGQPVRVRFGREIRSTWGGRVRCVRCRRLVPRAVILSPGRRG